MTSAGCLKAILIESLRLAAAGDWAGAHALIDDLDHPLACWLHASLHREEGDEGNARYWYGRAGRPFTRESYVREREAIAAAVASDAS